jgi:Icc-related predicted phosphoesterase
MRVLCLSDLHGFLPKLPSSNLVLIGGDIVPIYNHQLWFQEQWLDTNLRQWLGEIETDKIIFSAGNHDLIFEKAPDKVPKDLPWTYLQDSSTEFENLKIFGTPASILYNHWAFNFTEEEISKKWELIPEDTNILVVHGPPFGYGDMTVDGEQTGSKSLTEKIKNLKDLKLIVTGHIHCSRGKYKLNDKYILNSSLLNEQYEMTNAPFLVVYENNNIVEIY